MSVRVKGGKNASINREIVIIGEPVSRKREKVNGDNATCANPIKKIEVIMSKNLVAVTDDINAHEPHAVAQEYLYCCGMGGAAPGGSPADEFDDLESRDEVEGLLGGIPCAGCAESGDCGGGDNCCVERRVDCLATRRTPSADGIGPGSTRLTPRVRVGSGASSSSALDVTAVLVVAIEGAGGNASPYPADCG